MTGFSDFGRRWVQLPGVGAAFALFSAGGVAREKLTANRTYYVRTDGNNANTGLVDNAGGAFLTIAKAMAVIATIDLAGFVVTVQVGAGTWTPNVSLAPLLGGTAVLQGDTSTPSNVLISTSSGDAITANGVIGWTVTGFKVATTSLWGIRALNLSAINLGVMDFGACQLGHVYSASNSIITFTANYAITGAAPFHWQVFDGGRVVCQSRTITITGTPAFSSAFAIAGRTGSMAVNSNTFSGSATGVRYSISATAGGIDTAGGGATYLPG